MSNTQYKTAAEALKDCNSSTNQDIKGQFVAREVYCNVNELIEYALKQGWEDRNSPYSWDDVENGQRVKEGQYKYVIDLDERGEFQAHVEDEDGDTIWSITSMEHANQLIEDGFISDTDDRDGLLDYLKSIDIISKYVDEILEEDDDFETETQEIYEWWAVSRSLCEDLKKLGHPVLDDGYHHYWGRCTTGQAILLDYSISRICADMGILDGQQYSWAKKVN